MAARSDRLIFILYLTLLKNMFFMSAREQEVAVTLPLTSDENDTNMF